MPGLRPLVGVSGQIGAGKSTVVRRLAAELHAEPLLERFEDNPYLERYYRDPPSWALRNYLFFFEQSLADYARARSLPVGSVQERLPHEHLGIFGREFQARGFILAEDFALIERLERVATTCFAPPDLLLQLDVSPEIALVRLRERRNKADERITLEYLAALEARYRRFIDDWTLCPVLRIDTVDLDVRRDDDVRELARLVLRETGSRVEAQTP